MEYKHSIDHTLISLDGSPWADASSVTLTHQDTQIVLEKISSDKKIFYKIDHNALIEFPHFNDLKVTTDSSNSTEPLTAKLLLEPFDVDEYEVAWKRIASTARPIKDANLLRVCCKRAIWLNQSSFEMLGLCVCPVGYRILDADDPNDPDLVWFEQQSQRLLDWEEEVKVPAFARWSTSALMVWGYILLNLGKYEEGIDCLRKLLHYRASIRYAALIQTNLVRSSLLIADYEIKHGQMSSAIRHLEEISEITCDGIVFSDISKPKNGYIKFSEFEAVVRGTKEAKKALIAINQGKTPEQITAAYRVTEVGGYVSVLHKRGRIINGA